MAGAVTVIVYHLTYHHRSKMFHGFLGSRDTRIPDKTISRECHVQIDLVSPRQPIARE